MLFSKRENKGGQTELISDDFDTFESTTASVSSTTYQRINSMEFKNGRF